MIQCSAFIALATYRARILNVSTAGICSLPQPVQPEGQQRLVSLWFLVLFFFLCLLIYRFWFYVPYPCPDSIIPTLSELVSLAVKVAGSRVPEWNYMGHDVKQTGRLAAQKLPAGFYAFPGVRGVCWGVNRGNRRRDGTTQRPCLAL